MAVHAGDGCNMGIFISNVTEYDIDSIIEVENENFGVDAFNRRQFLNALKNPRSIFIKACFTDETGGGPFTFAGYALGFIKKTGKSAAPVITSTLYSIAVSKCAQGKSIGKKLLFEFHRELKSRDCHSAHLTVKVTNVAAIGLYEKYGYIRAGVFDDYYRDGAAAFKYVKRNI